MKKPLVVSKQGIAIIVGIVFIAVIIVITILTMPNKTETEIKDAIASSWQRTDFDIEDIVMQEDDWYLVKAASTNRDDRGNLSYHILKKENNSMKHILGPATAFSPDSLVDTGVPDPIIRYLLGDGPIFVGFETGELSAGHPSVFAVMAEKIIVLYARTLDLRLEWVNLAKDSYVSNSNANGGLFEKKTIFNAILNRGKISLSVGIIEKADDSGASVSINLYDQDQNLLLSADGSNIGKRYLAFGGSLPERRVESRSGAITLTDELVPKIDNEKLPPLETGDRVELYYSCPTNNSNPQDICRVYKYDFYY